MMKPDHPQRQKLLEEIQRLTNILGSEMESPEALETWLAKKQGRPRKAEGTADFDLLLKEAEVVGEIPLQPSNFWSPEMIEERRKEKQRESEVRLKEMLKFARKTETQLAEEHGWVTFAREETLT